MTSDPVAKVADRNMAFSRSWVLLVSAAPKRPPDAALVASIANMLSLPHVRGDSLDFRQTEVGALLHRPWQIFDQRAFGRT